MTPRPETGSERVTVSRCFFNIFTMQVCAVNDATDAEILEVCNRENRAGTTNGWATVLRAEQIDQSGESLGREPNKAPIACADDPSRTHFLVLC